ncbi:hypothetical protein [Xanthomonas sp. LMG 12460]|uniref:hypothetical protein n=1 Tax=Xanthomonas sp. LMG 12460 TaxID=1591132 RepID=UPI0012640516|nr:hypothetical protein [Xanthomonas sp. LMG 12460]KAB7775659.1 hypothetical protein CEK66_16675 [Xanthomonas sp. LMG 12460]
MSNIINTLNRAFGSAKTAVVVGLTALTVMPGFAMAAGDFDGSDIISKVVTYTAVGVSILGAFALGRWTLKALGIIGGR